MDFILDKNIIILNSFCLNTNLTMETKGIWLISAMALKCIIYIFFFHKKDYLPVLSRLLLASILITIIAPIYGLFMVNVGLIFISFPLFWIYSLVMVKIYSMANPNNVSIKKFFSPYKLCGYLFLFLSLTYILGLYLMFQIEFIDFRENPDTAVIIMIVVLFYSILLWLFSSLIEWSFIKKANINVSQALIANIPIYIILLLVEINRVYAVIALKKWGEINYCIFK